ncbi:MAG: CAP domain-containing protein [Candidatus Peribacteraceae bacterium]|nr:CAP domain-containing protein [Candidatus Peribacteraceae bacterium]
MKTIFLTLLLLLPTVTFAAAPRSPNCIPSQDEAIRGVDLAEVRRVWLTWINAERKKVGLKPYVQNPQLNRTAALWSKTSRNRGVMSHKRDGQTTYYDYPLITKWFSALGLTFRNVKRMTYSESIGYGPFSCSGNDCTQELINSLRSTFDFYLKEKGSVSRPHYNAIVNPEFRLIGTGFAIDPDSKRYYVTTHYATAITSRPTAVCAARS